jgi:hypothetical protein
MKLITEKQNCHQHTTLDSVHSVDLHLQEVLPARHINVGTAGNTGPDVEVFQACYHQRPVCKAVDSNNMLLEQPNNKDELSLSTEGMEKFRKGNETRTNQVMVISMAQIYGLL